MAAKAPDVDTTPRTAYLVAALALVAISGVLGVVIRGDSKVIFHLQDGVTAFAVLFVLAQALERLNLILVPILDWLLGKVAGETASKAKSDALSSIRLSRLAATDPTPGKGKEDDGKSLDEDAKTVTRANVEKALLTTSLAFAVGILGIALLKFSLLGALGYEGVPAWVDVLVTAAAISGGAAGLGDLISKIQKSKTSDETGAAATGT